ncbi:hypothetical protein CHS0354_035271, partial [Potamilus streckersoni]
IKQDRLFVLAQSLAYASTLSVVPLFIIFFSLLGKFSQQASVQGKIFGFVSKFMIPDSISGVFQQLEKISSDALKLGVIGFPSLVIIGIFMYLKVDDSINIIWRTTIRRRWQSSIVSFIMSIVFGPLTLIMLSSLPAYLQAVPFMNEIIESPIVLVFIEMFLPMIVGIFIFFFLYMYVPMTHVKWWAALTGGAAASLLIWISNLFLGLYFSNFGKFDVIYGSISIIPIFLMWICYLWIAILLGAAGRLYCAKLQNRHRQRQFGQLCRPVLLNKVIVIFFTLTDRFQKKSGSPTMEELEQSLEIPLSEVKMIMD